MGIIDAHPPALIKADKDGVRWHCGTLPPGILGAGKSPSPCRRCNAGRGMPMIFLASAISLPRSRRLHRTVVRCCRNPRAAHFPFRSSGEVHATAYCPEQRMALVYGDSPAQPTGDGRPVPPTFQKAGIPSVFALCLHESGTTGRLEKIHGEASGRERFGWPQSAQAA